MTASKNLPASIKQRLLNLSRERGLDFNLVLTRYGVERILYRLSCPGHRRSRKSVRMISYFLPATVAEGSSPNSRR